MHAYACHTTFGSLSHNYTYISFRLNAYVSCYMYISISIGCNGVKFSGYSLHSMYYSVVYG